MGFPWFSERTGDGMETTPSINSALLWEGMAS